MSPTLLAKAAAGLLAFSASALASDAWIEDLETGFAEARATGKHLLVDFTGSDWCPPCKALHAELLSKPSFEQRAGEAFVLVSLDYPSRKPQPADLKERNAVHKDTYAIRGFPTLIAMTPEGVEYGRRVGYQRGLADDYQAWILRLADNRDAVVSALAVLEEELPADEAERDAYRTRQVGAAASLVTTLGVDAPARATLILELHDPDDTTLARAHLAVLGFEARFTAEEEPNFEAMYNELTNLASDKPTVKKLGTYHAWRALAASQIDKPDVARSALDEARKLDAPEALVAWVASMFER